MSTPILDPSLPANNSPISSAELRLQFQAIQCRFDIVSLISPLSLTVSDPPTQAEMQTIANKLDEVIAALHGG